MPVPRLFRMVWIAAITAAIFCGGRTSAEEPWVVYDGFDGPGKGKHIVLVSGDEEYRSEEALPQLGKILAKHHGFKCTVLFAIDPINPDNTRNIPGLEDRIPAKANVDLVGKYEPLPFGFGKYKKDVKPSDHALETRQ